MKISEAFRFVSVVFIFAVASAAPTHDALAGASASIAGSLEWLQQKTTENYGASGNYYGSAVAMSADGKTALVGASGQNNGQGVAYVLRETNGVWGEVAELVPGDAQANERFGTVLTLSADGKTALVGAWNKTVNSNTEQGAAYVFTTSDNWATHTQAAELTASDGASQDDFGNSVALSADGATAAVGSPGGGSVDQGVAYVYATSDGWATYTQTAELSGSDVAAGDSFAQTVSLSDSGTTLLAGTPGRVINGNQEQGAAYIFALNGGVWSQVTELMANNGTVQDSFGGRVALSADGTTALIAAYGTQNSEGSAYVFTTSNGWTTSTQVAELIPSDGASHDQFGWDVAISDDDATAVVGSIGANVGSNVGQGKAYVFRESGGNWSQTAEVTESDGVTADAFASTVALSANGASMLAGSGCHPYDPGTATCGPGAAYFYGGSDISLAVSSPAQVNPGGDYVAQTLATNSSSTASAAVAVAIPVPAAASYVSATPSQGSCNETAGVVTCDLGPIAGNAGQAGVKVTLKAPGSYGSSIDNAATLLYATPPLTATATTSVAADTAPTASDGTLTVSENGSGSGTLNASDANGDPLTFGIVSSAGHGTVSITNASSGAFTYKPDSGYSGSDSFTFKANDGYMDSNIATISVTVKQSASGGSSGGGAFSYLSILALMALLGMATMIRTDALRARCQN